MNQRGSVLIIVLLVLMLGSLIAISAITISTTETRIANNEKSFETAFAQADAGIAPGLTVLLNTYKNKAVVDTIPAPTTATKNMAWTDDTYVSGSNTLLDEVMGASHSPNKGFWFQAPHDPRWDAADSRITKTTVIIERDRATAASTGSSVEFGGGYEGVGYGSGSGINIFYFIRATGAQTATNSTTTVETEYRRVSRVGE
jgi:Tfp pilus assembly protein PilX